MYSTFLNKQLQSASQFDIKTLKKKSLNGYTCKHRVKPTGFHSFLHTHMLAEQKVTDNGQKIKDLQLRRAVTAELRGFECCDLEGKGIR